MGIRRLFTEHPVSVGETYFQHLWVAIGFSGRMFAGAIACFIHALLPFTFQHTGSECISCLYERMVTNRRRRVLPPPKTPAQVTRPRAAH